jgi:hypothetical protein
MSSIDITRLDSLMWRVAHMETGIYLDFKEGCFNDRQEAHSPADLTDATAIARAMREIGDWCAQNIYAMCFCDTEAAKRIVSYFSLADWAVLTSIPYVRPDRLDMELFALIEDEGICASLGMADGGEVLYRTVSGMKKKELTELCRMLVARRKQPYATYIEWVEHLKEWTKDL